MKFLKLLLLPMLMLAGALQLRSNDIRKWEPTEALKAESAENLRRAQVIEAKVCKSFIGKNPSERSKVCNQAELFRLVLEAQHEKVRRGFHVKHITEIEKKVTKAYSVLAHAIDRDLTDEERVEMIKANDFFQGRVDQETFLKN